MKKLSTLLISLLLAAIALPSYSQTIHFIMVTDPAASGTSIDKRNMFAEIDNIGRACNMRVNKQAFSKRQSNEYKAAINNLRAGSDDVVFFYYAGHGRNSGNGWPQFSSIKETYVHEKLKSKGARLAVTMFDCCNIGPTETPYEGRTKLNPSIVYVLMFKTSKGDVMASSSSPSKLSWGSSGTGGFYTSSFLAAMKNVEDNGANIWDKVANITKNSANAMCRQIRKTPQEPQFRINVTTTTIDGGDIHNAPEYMEVPYSMTAQQLLEYCKSSHPNDANCKNLTIDKLKRYNNGGTYKYAGKDKPLFKIYSSSTNIPKKKVIWLTEPPREDDNW